MSASAPRVLPIRHELPKPPETVAVPFQMLSDYVESIKAEISSQRAYLAQASRVAWLLEGYDLGQAQDELANHLSACLALTTVFEDAAADLAKLVRIAGAEVPK